MMMGKGRWTIGLPAKQSKEDYADTERRSDQLIGRHQIGPEIACGGRGL